MIEPGTKVCLKSNPNVIGIAKSLPKGSLDLVNVYWGTSDGVAVYSTAPASQLCRVES